MKDVATPSLASVARRLGLTAEHADRRAAMLRRINALLGGGHFSPEILDEIVGVARQLSREAGRSGDHVTGELAEALADCVHGFAGGGEPAIRVAAAALDRAAGDRPPP